MTPMRKTAQLAPPAPWLGGKRMLAKHIIARIDRIDHRSYIEPFIGMGGVFLRRVHVPKAEVINDRNGEIVNLFRVLQCHPEAVIKEIQPMFPARREFERQRALDPAHLTDVQRAARFLYLQRLAFGGQVGGVFGVSPDRPARFNGRDLAADLMALSHRFAGVQIENLDWADVLARYDAPGALFYLDPPYWGGEEDYGKGLFDRAQFAKMAEILAGLKGAFVLSINDRPEIRALFAGFEIEAVSLKYSISQRGATDAAELIISNRAPRVTLL